MSVPAVRLDRVARRFGDVRALDEVTLDVEDGEFFSLLGPSGSGKTTCLRLIAGFDRPTSGAIELHGVPAASLPPYERDVNTVFQDYALFPHMTVAENVAYGLTVKGVPRDERRRRVGEMLDLVRLPGVGDRRPAHLSGGQRQRVALARALVNRPRVLLLDEPLGALDLKLRQQMQAELKTLQRRLGITFLYVTHDQEEALSMSDRLAVFREGRIQQRGTPAEVYERPRTAFVADFVGTSNLVPSPAAALLGGGGETFAVRPEKIRLVDPDAPKTPEACGGNGTIEDVVYLGGSTRYRVAMDAGVSLTVVEPNREVEWDAARRGRGGRVGLAWPRAGNRPIAPDE